MKLNFLVLLTLLIFAPFLALAQPVGGGPGPGPTPDPWVLNGGQIYYSQGCVTVSSISPGACNGVGSLNADTLYVRTAAGIHGTAILPLTGLSTIATNTVLGNSTSGTAAVTALAAPSCSTATSALIWTTNTGFGCNSLSSSFVTTLNFGSMGFTPSSATSGAITVAGTLVVGNGGTGAATFTSHGVLYGNTASAFGATAAGTTGQYFKGATGSAPVWGTLASDAVTTLSFGTTGLTPNSATSGALTVAGTLVVSNGGTGATSLTGVLKGTGTSAFAAATAGTDFVAPGTATTFTAKQTFTGTSSNLASALVNAAEPATIAATAATGTIQYDVCTQSVLYFTTNASANWTLNIRCSAGTSLNTAMATGDVVTVVHMVTQGASPFYNNVLNIDGSAVTPKCQGGTCPSAGNASGIDAYTYAIVKTGSAAFTVLESQTQFK